MLRTDDLMKVLEMTLKSLVTMYNHNRKINIYNNK